VVAGKTGVDEELIGFVELFAESAHRDGVGDWAAAPWIGERAKQAVSASRFEGVTARGGRRFS
jgi:hypothetical protein